MADRSSDLEIFRDTFLHELTQTQPELNGYQDFLRYWKCVEAEAQHTEDLGDLDAWVRDLARDKERVAALRSRTDMMTSDKDGGHAAQAMNQILKIVMEMLEAVERRIRRLRDDRLSILASLLWKGGPGTIAKPKPDEEDKKDGKKKEGGATGALEASQAAATAKQPDVKSEKDKKLDR